MCVYMYAPCVRVCVCAHAYCLSVHMCACEYGHACGYVCACVMEEEVCLSGGREGGGRRSGSGDWRWGGEVRRGAV